MNFSSITNSTSVPFLTGTTLPETYVKSLLMNFTLLSNIYCNGKGIVFKVESEPGISKYKCICDRFNSLTNYAPCIKCFKNTTDPSSNCADVCWPKAYNGEKFFYFDFSKYFSNHH